MQFVPFFIGVLEKSVPLRRKRRERPKQNNTKHKKLIFNLNKQKREMKKTYIQPAVELLSVEIEQGIAQSGIETANFGINNASYEEVDW